MNISTNNATTNQTMLFTPSLAAAITPTMGVSA
jgi:hypothetical protein